MNSIGIFLFGNNEFTSTHKGILNNLNTADFAFLKLQIVKPIFRYRSEMNQSKMRRMACVNYAFQSAFFNISRLSSR